MSKGEKRSRRSRLVEPKKNHFESRVEEKKQSRAECRAEVESSLKSIWVLELPSMPKGETVGKYCTDNECVLAKDNESTNGCH